MPTRKLVPVGTRFNRLVVLASFPHPSRTRCKVRCDCGNEFEVSANALQRGNTGSCGCLQVERTTKHGMWKTPEYNAWRDMRSRCYRSTHRHFKNWGGRGITVCERWRESFEAFYEDMGPRPEGHSIDRIDNSGNYEPGNCRWTTSTQQLRNTRRNNLLTVRGRTQCITAWADESGICSETIHHRLRAGWEVEAAIFTPPHGYPEPS